VNNEALGAKKWLSVGAHLPPENSERGRKMADPKDGEPSFVSFMSSFSCSLLTAYFWLLAACRLGPRKYASARYFAGRQASE